MLDLFPDSAVIEDGELAIGGLRVTALAQEYGTPLVVYCERTLRERARLYRAAAPDALVAYGSKAFPNVAVLRLFADEGLGADVSTLGELRFAAAAGVPADRLVVHGSNKSDEELRAAADLDAGLVVIDAFDEVERAAAAGIRRVLVRVASGIEADTHEAVRTGSRGSKLGLPPEHALAAVRDGLATGLDVAGLHVHVGSQLLDTRAVGMSVEWLAGFAARCRKELDGWAPMVVDLGGGLGVRQVDDDWAPSIGDFVGELLTRLGEAWTLHDLPQPRVVLEPGRSLVGSAGVMLYRVGVVKRASEEVTYVAVDGGLSDNPRPLLYGARYTALLANRAAEAARHPYSVTGRHCEEDLLVRRVELPKTARGDLLAVPAAGAYTLAMSSNYNLVPRPAAVLVADGRARVIRARDTVVELLAKEAG